MLKSQSALEYLMVMALILGIIVPVTYLFYKYSSDSNTQILDAQLNRIGRTIIDTAESVYYSGESSKITIELKMPGGIDEIEILQNRELVFTYSSETGIREAVFFSSLDIPIEEGSDLTLIKGPGIKKIVIEAVDDGGTLEVHIRRECTAIGATCIANSQCCSNNCDTGVTGLCVAT